jgi:transglycosylase-like protein with SLT domain
VNATPTVTAQDPASDEAPPQDDDAEAAVDWRAFVPTDTADHLATMDRAARDSNCGVPWQLLAAIARVESDFGRNMSTSSAGAIGYGQFLPSSWQAFGGEGNVYDYRDALPAIALYLCRSGLDRDPRAALFAYNHADWYVDLVLNLAVRYDRMAPGAPTPDVLGVGPATQEATRLQYARSRDLRLQTRARATDAGERWLGIPWRGRAAGQSVAEQALGATTLDMLRTAFGLRGASPPVASLDAAGFADAAWDGGLLGLPGEGLQWSVAEVQQHLRLGQPVVVFVSSHGLPGHPADEPQGDQPLVLIGTTPDGFIYNDPTFSSSLGYGLELSQSDLLKFWDTPARRRQAMAFVARPKPPARQAHIAEAEAPEPLARATATATTVPTAKPTVLPTPTEVPVPTNKPVAVPTLSPVAAPATVSDGNDSPSATFGIALFGGAAAVAIGLRRRRGGRSR